METNHFLYIYIFLVFLRVFLVEKTILFLDTFPPTFLFFLEWLTVSVILENSLAPRSAVLTSFCCGRSCPSVGHPARTTRDRGSQGPRPFLQVPDPRIGSLPPLSLTLDSQNFRNPMESPVQGQDELKGKRRKNWLPPAPLMEVSSCSLVNICVYFACFDSCLTPWPPSPKEGVCFPPPPPFSA